VVRPWTARRAIEFTAVHHRRLPRQAPTGLWALRLERNDEVVGCIITGKLARGFEGTDILTVIRCTVIPGVDCGCSRLYGAASRTARSMGARGLVTYTHRDEPGTSLVASGWVREDLPNRTCNWESKTRKRITPVDAVAKIRWWAPWSERVTAKLIDIETKAGKKPEMFHPDGCYRSSGHCDCAGDGHYVCTVCARHEVAP